MIIKQLHAKLDGCPREHLRDEKFLREVAERIVSALNMTVVKRVSHVYNPGVSVVFLLAESHLSIHTWPEIGFVDLEIESCKEESDVLKGLEIAIKMLKPKHFEKYVFEYKR